MQNNLHAQGDLAVNDIKQQLNKHNPLHQSLHLIKELRANGLTRMDDYKIIVRRAKKFNNLVQFHYHQTSNFKHQISCQSRGIILDQSNNWSIVALPYYKFFDYNDAKNSDLNKFNFKNYKVYQKHDGSIAIMYFYKGQWMVGSAKIPDGSGPYCSQQGKAFSSSFSTQFWRIFKEKAFKLPQPQDNNKTFVFELMPKNHIIVVRRESDDMVLHGVRNIDNLQEQDHRQYGKKYGWTVNQHIVLDIKDQQNPIKQIVQLADRMDPCKQQGFILCDHNYIRMKVKGCNYFKVHWLAQISGRDQKEADLYIITQIILTGDAQLFCQYIPNREGSIRQFQKRISMLNAFVMQIFDAIRHLDKKSFSQEAKKNCKTVQGILFSLNKNQQQFRGRVQHSQRPNNIAQFLIKQNFEGILKGAIQI